MWFGRPPIELVEWATAVCLLGAAITACAGHPRAFVGFLIAAGIGGAIVLTVIIVAANRP